MRVGVIRGDLPGPLFIADLEPTSQSNFPVEPPGQTRYLSRPSATKIQAYLDAQGLVSVATTLITATVPVGGPLNVASATIKAVAGLGAATDGQVTALQDLLAPRFIETDVVLKSYQVGMLADWRSANFNPDPNRLPALSNSAAIAIVQDDGSTAFSSASLAPVPAISGAAFGGGNLTITGTGLGNSEFINSVKVKVWDVTTGVSYTVSQRNFVAAGGSVSPTSVVVPASLLPGMAAGAKVQLLFTSLASNVFTAT